MEVEIPYTLSENFSNAKGDGIKKFFRGIATVGLAPSRGAFLVLMQINPLGLTTKLAAGFVKDPDFTPEAVDSATPKWEKFKKTWTKLGGSVAKLEKNIKKGYKRKAGQKVNDAFKKALKNFKRGQNFDGNYNVAGAAAATTVSATTVFEIVLAAMPVLVLAINTVNGIKKPLFKKGTPGDKKGTPGELVEEDIETEIPIPEPEVAPEITTDPQGNPVNRKGQPIEADKIFGLPKNGVYAGGILLTLGIVSLIWKPWKAKTAAK